MVLVRDPRVITVNMAEIPRTESPAAFLVVCLMLLLPGLLQLWLFRRRGWV